MQQHGGADAHRVAGDGGDDGLFEAGDEVQEGNRGAGVTDLAMQEVGEVVAGGEHVLLAAQQHHPDMAVVAGMRQRRAHGAVHVGGDGVLLVAAADLDDDDAVTCSLTRMLGWLIGSEAFGWHGQGGVVEAAQEFVPLADLGQFPAVEPAAGGQFATIEVGIRGGDAARSPRCAASA
jgi:hypothetical protein